MGCPRTRIDPLAAHQDPQGWWHFMCPICLVCTPRTSRDYDQALFYFWQEHDFRNKEIKMSATDYQSGYKQGVEDGTSAFGSEHLFPDTGFKVHTSGVELLGLPLGVRIEQLLKDRRKKLLTKKVTKWVTVFSSDTVPFRASSYLFDSKEAAQAANPRCANFIGAYPIEIETTI